MDGWIVSGWYADDVKPPKRPRDLAIEVWCGNEHTRDLEERVMSRRLDIGVVGVQAATAVQRIAGQRAARKAQR